MSFLTPPRCVILAKFCFPSELVSVSVRWGYTQLAGELYVEEGLSLEARLLGASVPAGRTLVVEVWGYRTVNDPLSSLRARGFPDPSPLPSKPLPDFRLLGKVYFLVHPPSWPVLQPPEEPLIPSGSCFSPRPPTPPPGCCCLLLPPGPHGAAGGAALHAPGAGEHR